MIIVATLATFVGFCLANGSAFATLRFNVWRAAGDAFQLGYVVGYLDAVRLAQRKDFRMMIPAASDKDFTRWVRAVNAFYENPANQHRPVPDAIYEFGTGLRNQMLREWGLKRQGRPVPSPSALP